jgi:CheY-like chemotaxis protein
MSACNILFVEHNDADILLFRHTLRQLLPHAEMSFVRNATQASVFLKQEEPYANVPRPDLIIANCELSGESGLELLEWVRSHPRLREIPFVILCGIITPQEGERAHELGATHVIQVPVGADELGNAIREALDKGLPRSC